MHGKAFALVASTRLLLPLLLPFLACVGCGHSPPPPCTGPEPISVMLKAGEPMNPDDTGKSFPTIVRVYLLKSAGILETASADELLRGDRELLGSELLDMQEVTVKPASYERLSFKRQDNARAVAVVALFRAPVGNTWRLISTLPPPDADHCHKTQQPAGPRIGVVLEGSRVSTSR